jgi:hypothetical protein
LSFRIEASYETVYDGVRHQTGGVNRPGLTWAGVLLDLFRDKALYLKASAPEFL